MKPKRKTMQIDVRKLRIIYDYKVLIKNEITNKKKIEYSF
jgi:hypothetical protein